MQARLGEVSAIAHESFDGVLVVKTLGLADREDDRFRAAAGRLRSERIDVASLTAVFEPLIDLLPNLGMVALLVAGAWRIDSGAATPGQLVQAVALFGWLAFPMRIVGFLFQALPRSVVSVRRVDDLLDEPVDLAAQGRGSLDPDALDPAAATVVPGAPPPARRTAEVLAARAGHSASIGEAPARRAAVARARRRVVQLRRRPSCSTG